MLLRLLILFVCITSSVTTVTTDHVLGGILDTFASITKFLLIFFAYVSAFTKSDLTFALSDLSATYEPTEIANVIVDGLL